MTKLVSWNIAKRRNAWRELCKMDVDVALLQEAGNVPSDVSEAVDDGPRANWDPQVWNADYGDRWSTGLSERWCKIVKLSDRVEVEWFKQISPISMPSKDEVAVSGIGTIAIARIIPQESQPFIAVSMQYPCGRAGCFLTNPPTASGALACRMSRRTVSSQTYRGLLDITTPRRTA